MGEVLAFRRSPRKLSDAQAMHPQYADVLANYTTHLRASGIRPRTIRLRLDHARDLLHLGFDAATDSLEGWMAPPDRSYAPETLRSRRASARRFYGWLHETGQIGTNPAAALRAIRVPTKPPRVIPDLVFRRALADASPRDRAILMLGRYSALRLNEIAELQIGHRDGERLTILGKGGTVRHVWLTPDIEAALDELEDGRGRGYYFPGRFTGHIHREALHKIIKRVTGGWNPHSLRHAGATAAYRGTRNLRGVQQMLGHASLATTQRYLTVDDDEMRALARAARLDTAA